MSARKKSTPTYNMAKLSKDSAVTTKPTQPAAVNGSRHRAEQSAAGDGLGKMFLARSAQRKSLLDDKVDVLSEFIDSVLSIATVLNKREARRSIGPNMPGAFDSYSIVNKQEQAHDDSIWSCAWRKNQNTGTDTIVTGSVDDHVKLWRWTGDRMEQRCDLEGHQLGIVSVDINQLGTIAASSSLDSHIKLWDLEAGKQIKTLDAGPVDCWTLCFSPDGKSLVTGSHTGKVNVFGIDSGKKELTLDTRGKFTLSVAYSPDGKYVACGAIDGIINVFDMTAGGRLMHTLEGHAMPVRCLSFSADSQLLVTASDDSLIKLYDVQNGSLISTVPGHQSWVLSVDFSPDNSHFVSSSSDRTVKVWETSSKTCVHTFYDHNDQVWCAKYNSNGSNIVSVGDDHFVCIYECPL